MINEEQKCSEILRGDTRSDVLRHQLEELTKELGEVEEVDRFEMEKLPDRGDGV